jgi:hypothetical protein
MDANRSTLFDSTSKLAGEVAARASSSRRQAIIAIIQRHGPLAIFEIARLLGCHDHQISGRFGEMERDGLLIKTGERRIKPNTKCDAEVYGLPDPKPTAPHQPDAAELLGYPNSLKIGDEGIFVRSPILGDNDLPGIPYSLHSSAAGLRSTWRVELIECPGCGRHIKMITKGEYRCGTPGCNRTWFPMLVSESGKTPVLALVMRFM